MTLRPCIECGEPAEAAHCPDHARPSSPKASATQRGYDAAWARLSARARRLQPWCDECGVTEDLQCDHSPQAWARKAAGKPIRLRDVRVLCGSCNRAAGRARPANDAATPANTRLSAPWGLTPAQGLKDPRGEAKSEKLTENRPALDLPANSVANGVAS